MNDLRITLDAHRRELTVNREPVALVEKEWQVLGLLLRRAPAVVSRSEFVDDIWQGNWAVGEKNLTQAIWSIRRALSDNSRAPSCIRTIPRSGYQWIADQPIEAQPEPSQTSQPWQRLSRVASLPLLGMLTLALFSHAPTTSPSVETSAPPRVAEAAYTVGDNVHVRFDDGLIGILQNASGKQIGKPVLSRDGRQIAIPLKSESDCLLATFDLNTRQRSDFEACPGDTI